MNLVPLALNSVRRYLYLLTLATVYFHENRIISFGRNVCMRCTYILSFFSTLKRKTFCLLFVYRFVVAVLVSGTAASIPSSPSSSHAHTFPPGSSDFQHPPRVDLHSKTPFPKSASPNLLSALFTLVYSFGSHVSIAPYSSSTSRWRANKFEPSCPAPPETTSQKCGTAAPSTRLRIMQAHLAHQDNRYSFH